MWVLQVRVLPVVEMFNHMVSVCSSYLFLQLIDPVVLYLHFDSRRF